MFEILRNFENIISSFKILLYERETDNSRLKLEVVFLDESKLIVRDYYFGGEQRKYVFHWMDKKNNLRVRWDNAEHWPDIATFPHHKHLGDAREVKASTEVLLEDVLNYIATQLNLP
ncbi:MAG: DUF6516 family protein [bacterium]